MILLESKVYSNFKARKIFYFSTDPFGGRAIDSIIRLKFKFSYNALSRSRELFSLRQVLDI